MFGEEFPTRVIITALPSDRIIPPLSSVPPFSPPKFDCCKYRLVPFRMARIVLYSAAKAARFLACSRVSLSMVCIFSLAVRSRRNSEVITSAWGKRILTPYRPPPKSAERMAANSLLGENEDDVVLDMLALTLTCEALMTGTAWPAQPIK